MGKRTDCANKDLKRAVFDVGSAAKVDEFDFVFTVKNNILIFDIPVDDEGFGMQVVQGGNDLREDIAAFSFVHSRAHFNVVKKVHPRETMRDHLDIIIYVVFKEVGHLHDIRVTKAIFAEVVKDVDFERNGAESTVPSPGVNEDSPLGDVLEDDFRAVSGVCC